VGWELSSANLEAEPLLQRLAVEALGRSDRRPPEPDREDETSLIGAGSTTSMVWRNTFRFGWFSA
jgi:hypothetical protein